MENDSPPSVIESSQQEDLSLTDNDTARSKLLQDLSPLSSPIVKLKKNQLKLSNESIQSKDNNDTTSKYFNNGIKIDKAAMHPGGSQDGLTAAGRGGHSQSGAQQTGNSEGVTGNTGGNNNGTTGGSGGDGGDRRKNTDDHGNDDAEVLEVASETTTTTSSSVDSSLGSTVNLPTAKDPSPIPESTSNIESRVSSTVLTSQPRGRSDSSGGNSPVGPLPSVVTPSFRSRTKAVESDISVTVLPVEHLSRASPGSSLTTTSSSSGPSLGAAATIAHSLRELVEVSTAAPEDSEQEGGNEGHSEKHQAISQVIEKSKAASHEAKDPSCRVGSYESSDGSQGSEVPIDVQRLSNRSAMPLQSSSSSGSGSSVYPESSLSSSGKSETELSAGKANTSSSTGETASIHTTASGPEATSQTEPLPTAGEFATPKTLGSLTAKNSSSSSSSAGQVKERYSMEGVITIDPTETEKSINLIAKDEVEVHGTPEGIECLQLSKESILVQESLLESLKMVPGSAEDILRGTPRIDPSSPTADQEGGDVDPMASQDMFSSNTPAETREIKPELRRRSDDAQSQEDLDALVKRQKAWQIEQGNNVIDSGTSASNSSIVETKVSESSNTVNKELGREQQEWQSLSFIDAQPAYTSDGGESSKTNISERTSKSSKKSSKRTFDELDEPELSEDVFQPTIKKVSKSDSTAADIANPYTFASQTSISLHLTQSQDVAPSVESSENRPQTSLSADESKLHTKDIKVNTSQPPEKESVPIRKISILQSQPSEQSQSQPLFQLGQILPTSKSVAASNLAEPLTEKAVVGELDSDSHQSSGIIGNTADPEHQQSFSIVAKESQPHVDVGNAAALMHDSHKNLATTEAAAPCPIVTTTVDSHLITTAAITVTTSTVSASFDDSAPTDLTNVKSVVEKVVKEDSSGSSTNFQFALPTTGTIFRSGATKIAEKAPHEVSTSSITKEAMAIGKPIARQSDASATMRESASVDSEKFPASISKGEDEEVDTRNQSLLNKRLLATENIPAPVKQKITSEENLDPFEFQGSSEDTTFRHFDQPADNLSKKFESQDITLSMEEQSVESHHTGVTFKKTVIVERYENGQLIHTARSVVWLKEVNCQTSSAQTNTPSKSESMNTSTAKASFSKTPSSLTSASTIILGNSTDNSFASSTNDKSKNRRKSSSRRLQWAVKPSLDPTSASKKGSLSSKRSKSDTSAVITSTPEHASKSVTPSRSLGISPTDSSITIGNRVFARWSLSDSHYYPGRVVRGDRSNSRYTIAFDDGTKSTISSKHIVVKENLAIGQAVLCQAEENYFDPGTIINYEDQDGSIYYHVRLDGSGKVLRFLRKEIILTESQAQSIRSSSSSAATTSLSDASPSFSGARDSSKDSSSVTRTSSSGSRGSRTSVHKEIVGIDKNSSIESMRDEIPPPAKAVSPAKTASRKRKAIPIEKKSPSPKMSPISSSREASPLQDISAKKSKVDTDDTTEKGPILQNSTMFEGLVFILTRRERHSDESFVASSEELTPTYDKEHVKKQIEAAGGQVLSSIEKSQITVALQCFLISNEYCRTTKYIQALAAGLPCVRHTWIIDCCQREIVLGYHAYLLPSGYSIVMKIIYHLKDTCAGILMWAGCTEVKRLPSRPANFVDKDIKACDVIITEDSGVMDANTNRKANVWGIPIITFEWVIQSLIHGYRLPFDAHEKFRA
ncbi:Tumor suppressor p53-binding protein 1 [Trichoplax sp. H2]|nr:Tumor suppressor p53-binding protein 1 [Trichoplax sp. H2]|eukprot:RDD46298.1 Tumor suppressor p53-binding protein 1 [Trichoplax sp. H2]